MLLHLWLYPLTQCLASGSPRAYVNMSRGDLPAFGGALVIMEEVLVDLKEDY